MASGAGRVRVPSDRFASLVMDGWRHTVFRIELQATYREPGDDELLARFVAGDPAPPEEMPGLPEWLSKVRQHVAAGRRVTRVRVHDDPPTDYQRWEQWVGRANVAAGEEVLYLSRSRAFEVGLLPDAGGEHGLADWWLLDSRALLVMHFDASGGRIDTELVTVPGAVGQACVWRDLAVHHSTPLAPGAAAA